METPTILLVRATIHLPGLRVGEVVRVDAEDEYVAACLKQGYLVVEGDEQ